MKTYFVILLTFTWNVSRAQVVAPMEAIQPLPPRILDVSCDEIAQVLPGIPLAQLTTSCFEQRQWHAHSDASDAELLQRDIQTCECLKDDTSILLRTSFNPLEGPALRLQEVSSAAALQNAHLQASRNGMLMNAHLLDTDGNQETDLTRVYSQNRVDSFFQAAGLFRSFFDRQQNQFEQRASRYVADQGVLGGILGGGRRYRDQVRQHGIIRRPTLDRNLLRAPESSGPKQCVGSKEYLGFRKTPSSNAFYQDLLSMSENFVESDWDAKQLNRRIDRLPAGSEERVRLEARLQFLNRNPLVKNLFSADFSTNAQVLFKSIPGMGEFSQILTSRHWQNLAQRKRDLFRLVKTLAPATGDCGQEPGQCQVNLYQGGTEQSQFKKFQRDAEIFFSNPDVAFLTNVEGEKETARNIEEMANFERAIPVSQEGIETLLNLTPPHPGSTSECMGIRVEVGPCVDLFSRYCPIAQASLSASRDPAKVRRAEMQMDLVNDLETDINKNPALAQFNREVCNTSRVSKGTSGLPASADFWEFKAFCEASGRAGRNPACAATEMNGLVAAYLEHYPSKNPQEPPVMTGELAAKKDKELLAFREHLLQAPVFNLDPAQVAKVAETSGDPAAVEAAANAVNGNLVRQSYPNGNVPAHLRRQMTSITTPGRTTAADTASPQGAGGTTTPAPPSTAASVAAGAPPIGWTPGQNLPGLPEIQQQRDAIAEGLEEARRTQANLPAGDPRVPELEQQIRNLQAQLQESDRTLQEFLRRRTAEASSNPPTTNVNPVAQTLGAPVSGGSPPAQGAQIPSALTGTDTVAAASTGRGPGPAAAPVQPATGAPSVALPTAARAPALGVLNQGLLEAKYAEVSSTPAAPVVGALVVSPGDREEVQQIIRLDSLEDYRALVQNRSEVLSKYFGEIDFSRSSEVTISASLPGEDPIFLRVSRADIDRVRAPASESRPATPGRVSTRDDLLRNLEIAR